MGLVIDRPDLDRVAREVGAALDDLEKRLLLLLQDGAGGVRRLPDVIADLVQLTGEIRPHYRLLHENLGRRDLSFAAASRLQELRHYTIWLYRKCRLEYVFFSKLQLERALREALYKQTVEVWQQMSALEDEERMLQSESDEGLARDLLGTAETRADAE